MDNIETLIGRRIANARNSRKLTQEQLAEQCNISISALSRIETGYNSTSLKTLIHIGNTLGVGLDYLLYDLLPQHDTNSLSPQVQEILFIIETLGDRDLSFIQSFLSLYAARIK